jgi:hypothetical protein
MRCNFLCSELEPLCMRVNVCVRARIFSYVNVFSPLLAHTLVHPHVHMCLCVLHCSPFQYPHALRVLYSLDR